MISPASLLSRAPAASPVSHPRTNKRRPTPSTASRFYCCLQQKGVWYNPERRRTFIQPDLRRRWVQTDAPLTSSPQDRFLICSYNILGDCNASKHTDLYSRKPSDLMRWDERKRLIFEELRNWGADMVCLQEVDRYDDLLNYMKKGGYAGSYKRRTGVAMDGCAMFWKHKLFRLLEGTCIEFQGFGLRDNVAQLFVFEMNKDDSTIVVVGNIHVLFNPNRGDIKLAQIRLFLQKAHALSAKWGGVPVLLAGDFNSTPQSAIYKFLSSSKLNLKLHDRRHLSGQSSCHPAQFFIKQRQPYVNRFLNYCWTEEELITASGDSKCTTLKHPLKLCSSYAKTNRRTRGPKGEPLATSYHSKFLGTVDYLWYSDGLVPQRVLDTLPIDVLLRTGGLPTQELGSDHLALVCEFAFTQKYARESLAGGETEEDKENQPTILNRKISKNTGCEEPRPC
ncbi:carbon catabolite repressor protein 4 homolog 3-like isoform X2 [Aristolochia californica]|uniref:carbon catabolite repressor protein 4 homolog 3-like isoform X2 n=1 Tax=Aristolochia californica TaxID=171875 RepID=UPI0035D8A066